MTRHDPYASTLLKMHQSRWSENLASGRHRHSEVSTAFSPSRSTIFVGQIISREFQASPVVREHSQQDLETSPLLRLDSFDRTSRLLSEGHLRSFGPLQWDSYVSCILSDVLLSCSLL